MWLIFSLNGRDAVYIPSQLDLKSELAIFDVKKVCNWVTIVNLLNGTGEESRRQTLCDKRDNQFV